jgi:hypothetical protein
MVFCGHCGYQLAAGDKVCPRCGAETDVEMLTRDPEANKPTTMAPNAPRPSSPRNYDNQPRRSTPTAPPQPAGPLVLGASSGGYANEQDATTMMNAPAAYAPQQVYAGYPPQSGVYGHTGYPSYQATALAQLLAASHRGKTNSLLLILFGLLLLIAAIIVFLLNLQGIIFTS